jgi:hypothetical protein
MSKTLTGHFLCRFTASSPSISSRRTTYMMQDTSNDIVAC